MRTNSRLRTLGVGRLRRAVDRRLRAVTDRLDAIAGRQSTLEVRLARLELAAEEAARRDTALASRLEGLEAATAGVAERLGERIEPLLRAVVEEEAANRRRLHAARGATSYDRAFTEPDPLVSVLIATRDRADVLVERALRSVLAQTHRNLEVIVVGDAAAATVGEAVAAVARVDPRVRYANLTQRTTADDDPRRHWLVGSTLARNEAARRAAGAWLLHFDDDDALRPDAIGVLLARARARRAEVTYGAFAHHVPGEDPDAPTDVRSGFPPAPGHFGFQGALMHAGLGFFERELVAMHLDLSGDHYLLRRMLRVGVRFAAVERVVWDYYPSHLWDPPHA